MLKKKQIEKSSGESAPPGALQRKNQKVNGRGKEKPVPGYLKGNKSKSPGRGINYKLNRNGTLPLPGKRSPHHAERLPAYRRRINADRTADQPITRTRMMPDTASIFLAVLPDAFPVISAMVYA